MSDGTRSWERVAALAHPLRRQILRELADAPEPLSAKQVAGRLGVPPTRLYHHVHKLIEVELLEVAAERPNRGTTEKLLRTRRREFRESVSGSDSAVYAVALHDGLAALSQDGVAEEPGSGVHTMSVSTRVSATPAALEELTTFVSDWVRRNRTKEGGIPIHLALALFRVDGQR